MLAILIAPGLVAVVRMSLQKRSVRVNLAASRNRHQTAFLAGFMIGLMLSAQACSAPGQAQIDQMIAKARTATDQEAIADVYEKEAAANRNEAANHLEIAKSYEERPHWGFDYSKVCRQMAQYYADLADADSELAKQHRKMAEEMRAVAARGTNPLDLVSCARFGVSA